MKTVAIACIVIWCLFHFSQSLFGFNATEMLKTEGIFGVAKQFICGKDGCQ